MTTRVSAEVTVVDQTDATGLVWWYYASTSATKPSKPNTTDATATPSGWSKSEPTISSEADLSKYVYSCLQTVWGDGTCTWGDVSTSASFEAAKQSYNKALSANSREQVVYYRSKVSTAPSAPTAWITATGNVYNDTATVGNAGWTRKVTPCASSTSSSATKYQYLFSCVQRQTVSQSSGTNCTCSDVLLEEYTTVIDGSLLVENSVTADHIQASTLHIGDMGDADDYYDKDEANQLAQPNLSPFFEVAYEKGDYWKNGGTFTAGVWTTLSDGWAHFERANTGSSEVSNLLRMAACPSVVQGQQYTCLLEFRNVSVTGNTSTYMYTQQSSYTQFWGNHSYDGWTINNSDIAALAGGKGEFRKLMTARGVSVHESTGIQLIDINQKVSAGQTISYDIRISLYAGEYTGPWKPYSGTQLYASQAELKVTSDNVSSKVSATDYNGNTIASLINQDATTVTIAASKVNIAGAAIFSSGGAYDTSTTVVSSETQWYSSTSATTKSGGTWATTQPSVTAGQYIWQRELVTYADGDTAYKPSSDGVCVQGQTDLSSYSTTTDMNAAIGAANSQEQLIYKSAADGTATMSGTTTWVTDVTGAQETWTAVRPEYSQSYPVLFVATQRKTVGGTVTCTTPAIDKTTTVIDGGSVIANSITASKIQAGSLTIGTFDQSVASSLRSGEAASLAFVPTKYAKTDTAHWYTVPSDYWTTLSDGWAHYEYTNTGSSAASTYISPGAWLPVVPGEAYTFLVEIRNFSGPTATNLGYMQQMAGAQFWGNEVVSANGVVSNTYIRYADLVNGAFTKRFVKLADVDHLSSSAAYDGLCFRYRFYAQKGGTTSLDVRISVYPGVYEGGFSEYPVGVRMSGAEAAIEQNADAIDSASRSLSSQIESLMSATEAIDGRTQAFQLSEADGLTIGSKAEGADMDFNINLRGEGMKFRYKQQVLATASGSGFDAPHLIAGTDLTIGSHWRWQELDGRLVLIYV